MPFASIQWVTILARVKRVSPVTLTTGALIWMSAEVNPVVKAHDVPTRLEAILASA